MRLRTAAFLTGVALVTAVIAGVAVAVSVVVDRAAHRQVEADLVESARVLADVLAYQQAQLQNDAQIVADEPRIKALFGDEVDPDTIAGEAARARERLGCELLLVSDRDGTLLVDVDHPDDAGAPLLDNPVTGPVFKGALGAGRGSGVWTSEGKVFRVQAQAIRFGDDVRGAILIGERLDDAAAATIASQIGSDVLVLLGPDTVARSLPGHPGAADATAGGRYAVTRAPFPGYTGSLDLGFVLLQDIDAALAPGRHVMRLLYLVFGAAVLAAIGVALLVSRRLAGPLDRLVGFTRAIAAGDLEQRCDARGLYEVRTLGESMNRMAGELAASRALLAEKERLERELQIASRIQTSIVPRAPSLAGYRVATHMATADEVGGDYYDVHETEAGGWIAIGDVSGHGLDAGLVMMMVQTAVSALVYTAPTSSPSDVLRSLNRVIFDNVHGRMQVHRHMTLSLLRMDAGGQVLFAGAHMDILVLRAATGACERVETSGTWIGIADDIDAVTVDARFSLQAGDTMILYTDGVTEATDASGQLFGLERLESTVVTHAAKDPDTVVDAIVRAVNDFQARQFDDFTIVIARRDG
ncbi:MAG TPA: SpoIIE family protein phosphatase [Kofleriaceae bacterium]|nr:SpoIIE family protein phosphatase [Kofleriaceae bacterium]